MNGRAHRPGSFAGHAFSRPDLSRDKPLVSAPFSAFIGLNQPDLGKH